MSAEDTFFQRILGANSDEALLQAETFLADKELVEYYDAVAVKGLRLAAEDQRRGTINPEQSSKILGAMRSVMDDLSNRSIAPAGDGTMASGGLSNAGGVACIAGGGTFDPAVSMMLAQVLRERGVSAKALRYEEASRANIADLDLSNITVIALNYLELTGSPAQVRYLIKRLRQRAPHAVVVAGLRGGDDIALADESLQQTIGADKYAASLEEAASQIMLLLKGRSNYDELRFKRK
ncbi:MAG: hypothetical protein NVS3B5_01390 [Sphingomicrobium sp.]